MALDEFRWLGRAQVLSSSRKLHTRRTALAPGFVLPCRDLGQLLEPLGCKLFPRERTLSQFVVWSARAGLFELLADNGATTIAEAAVHTPLTEAGADSLLGVLCALGLVSRTTEARYSLSDIARDYLVCSSPFYVADQLDSEGPPIPGSYVRQRRTFMTRMRLKVLTVQPIYRYGTQARLDNQHARNLAASAAAVRTGVFAEVSCLVDIGGGSGVFAIPLALEYPTKRIIIAELPDALANIRPVLATHGVEDRVELHALNALQFPWKLPDCDAIFMGNFLHGFDDDTCRRLCKESFERLPPGGVLGVHEIIWNERRDGPLMAALWHAAMRSVGPGRQRTGRELTELLESAGFVRPCITPTSGPFALISGVKEGSPSR